MLEVINKRKRKIDMVNMKFVNPFFKKDLVRNQKKLFKWLAKFNKKEIIEVAPKFDAKQPIDYNDYLAFINNANTLILTKYKKMTENLKVVTKLRNMIADYAAGNAIYSFICIIDDYYTHDKKGESYNKRQYWIKLNNQYVDQIWDRYKTEYLNFLRDDKTLKQKANDAFNFDKESDDELFFPKQTMDILFGFVKKLWGHKRISDRDFNTIYLYTLFTYYYIYALNRFMQRILLSFPTPKGQRKAKGFAKFFAKKRKKTINKDK